MQDSTGIVARTPKNPVTLTTHVPPFHECVVLDRSLEGKYDTSAFYAY